MLEDKDEEDKGSWVGFLTGLLTMLLGLFSEMYWLGIRETFGFGMEEEAGFSFNFTKDFLILIESENGDSWILQFRPEDLMVLRMTSHAVVGSMVGFFFKSGIILLVTFSNAFNRSDLFVCL